MFVCLFVTPLSPSPSPSLLVCLLPGLTDERMPDSSGRPGHHRRSVFRPVLRRPDTCHPERFGPVLQTSFPVESEIVPGFRNSE
jgi:hypothetical protein